MSERRAITETKELARVDSVFIGFEDHGIFTMMLQLIYENGSSQAFGGLALSYNDDDRGPTGKPMAGDFIIRILDLFGVNNIKELEGQLCYAITSGINQPIHALEGVGFGKPKKVFRLDQWHEFWVKRPLAK